MLAQKDERMTHSAVAGLRKTVLQLASWEKKICLWTAKRTGLKQMRKLTWQKRFHFRHFHCSGKVLARHFG